MVIKQRLSHVAKLTCALALSISPSVLSADTFVQTNLVSSVPGLANTTDPNLIDPWGVSFAGGSPFWVSNQGSGTTTLYDGAGNLKEVAPNTPAITVPGGTGGAAGPTGQVFNSTTSFSVNGAASHFIFDNLNGTISAWTGGASAVQVAAVPGATFTGLALASSGGSNYLYAADSTAITGKIDVFNSAFHSVALAGNFTDPKAIAGYVPFNIQLIGSDLYVTYALLNPDGSSQPGGYIDTFTTSGQFISRFASGGALNAPWGLALAPSTFGEFAGDLLVGNNGDGFINAFNRTTGAWIGTLDGTNGQPLDFQDLWALDFRTAGTNVDTNALYFAEGINMNAQGQDTGGIFGELTVATPEPSSFALIALGVLGLALLPRRPKAV